METFIKETVFFFNFAPITKQRSACLNIIGVKTRNLYCVVAL